MQLGDYRLLRRLGQGAMAEVYLAEQISLQRHVALKILKRELANDQTYIQRFQREARAAASLVHPNIVQIHEVGCVDGYYYIAQEYVRGVNLKQYMSRHGPLDARTAVIIMHQVAAALCKAAEQGIIHRDIKPENIMISERGEVKVADFGLARLVSRGDAVELTQAGMTMGTPLYMSPEQIEGKTLDHRSDIYSFGVTCYQMLAGVPPFQGETALSVAIQHLKKAPLPLEHRRPDLPPGLCRIVHKMLAKAREDRYQTPWELLQELRPLEREILGDVSTAEAIPAELVAILGIQPVGEHPTRRLQAVMKPPRRRWVPVVMLALWAIPTVAAFFAGGWLGQRWHTGNQLWAGVALDWPDVPKFDSVGAQVLYALHTGTREAWEAVIRYFPEETYYVRRAKKQLAWLALMEGRHKEAMQRLQELVSLDAAEPELQAFGLAGQYWLLVKEGRFDKAAEVLDALLPLQNALDDPAMRQLFRKALTETLERSRLIPGANVAEKWQKWLEAQTAEPSG
jgi:serine/threonine-protein kinase